MAPVNCTASPSRARRTWRRTYPPRTLFLRNSASSASAWTACAGRSTRRKAARNRTTSGAARVNCIARGAISNSRWLTNGTARARNSSASPRYSRGPPRKSPAASNKAASRHLPAPASQSGSALAGCALPQIRFEQPVNSLVLVEPGIGIRKSMAIQRVRRHAEIVLVQFDQALGQAHRILEQHIVVDHAVANEQCVLQAGGKFNRRRTRVGDRVDLRVVQNAGGVLVVVLHPIGDRTQRGARRQLPPRAKRRHQRHEDAVGTTADT